MKFMELDIQKFAGSQYTLRCYKNDGSSEYIDTSVRGSEPIPRNTFTRDGYDFGSWNTKADGTGTGFYVTNLCDDVIAAADYDSENDVYILYTLWNKIVNKYVTFRGLQKYDEKIKDYIDSTIPSNTEYSVVSNYSTGTNKYLDWSKIISTGFTGKLYNDLYTDSGTQVRIGNFDNYSMLANDFIEIIRIAQYKYVVYDGIQYKYVVNTDASGSVGASNVTKYNLSSYFRVSGTVTPEID